MIKLVKTFTYLSISTRITVLGRVLRKVENREAVLYEVIARGTIDEGKAQRRRRGQEEISNAYR